MNRALRSRRGALWFSTIPAQPRTIDLADNAHMRMLARDLGMKASPDPEDAHQVIYSLSLTDLPTAAGSRAVMSAAP